MCQKLIEAHRDHNTTATSFLIDKIQADNHSECAIYLEPLY